MHVTIFGTGYVGLGHGRLSCRQRQPRALRRHRRGQDRAAESRRNPDLRARAGVSRKAGRESGRLQFTTDTAAGVAHGLFQFIAVGTPPDEDGSADLRHVLAVARSIGEHLDDTASSSTNRRCPSARPTSSSAKCRRALDRRARARRVRRRLEPRVPEGRRRDRGLHEARPHHRRHGQPAHRRACCARSTSRSIAAAIA